MNITNLEVRRDYLGRHYKMATMLTVQIDGTPFRIVTEQTILIGQEAKDRQELEAGRIMRNMLNDLGRKIAEKLLEDHVTQAVLGITSHDPMIKELAKMALRAGL